MSARESLFHVGDRVTVTFGIWADLGLIGTVEKPAGTGYDWWVRFDERDWPVRFYERELVRVDAAARPVVTIEVRDAPYAEMKAWADMEGVSVDEIAERVLREFIDKAIGEFTNDA